MVKPGFSHFHTEKWHGTIAIRIPQGPEHKAKRHVEGTEPGHLAGKYVNHFSENFPLDLF